MNFSERSNLRRNSPGKFDLQDDKAHGRLLDTAAEADESEGIRQGLEDVKNGRVRPAREVLEAFRRLHKIPR